MVKTANVHAAKTQLSKLIEAALAGEDVIIQKAGKPAVRLVPVSGEASPRKGGTWKGQVRIAPDFDVESGAVPPGRETGEDEPAA